VNKGCCWQPTDGEPWCFYKRTAETGYKITGKKATTLGWELTIVSTDQTPYGNNISPLTVAVSMETAQRAHVKIYDPNNKRWEIPTSASPIPPTPSSKPSTTDYTIGLPEVGDDFYFSLSRNSGEEIFNTKATSSYMGLSFADQFLEISTSLPSNPALYGLGEHVKPLKLPVNDKITMWNADQATPNNSNIYGSHPFYMEMRSPGVAHGVFLRNSNGMDIVIGETSLTYRTIGGVLDFYFFLGPTPEGVVMQYHQVIGRPHMPPYWSLGFHNCRYGYPNVQTLEAVVANYSAAKIPLETMWTDIDYMDGKKDFTLDPVNFPAAEMNKLLAKLHSSGQHYVLIIDPGIANQNGYPAWDDGLSQGVFLKDKYGNVFIGRVWPGSTAFPDFFNPRAANYWKMEIKNFLDNLLNVDGLWIDMNEISNFCNGACSSEERTGPRKAFFDPNNPPYAINNFLNNAPLDTKTVSMDAVHYGQVLEYNAHNIFGLLEAQATSNALKELKNQRSFVLSRSTFPGSGQYTAHWLGDNHATYFDLHYSLIGMLNFQMFGVPFVGADICGFIGDTSEELCSRWIELGAFYPFSRVHSDIHSAPQELYRWPSVAAIARDVLQIRMRLLPFYYTLFYNAHRPIASLSSPSATVVRPLFFEFPSDINTYSNDEQFMIGSALMVCPVLEQGATSKAVYFPKASWYDLITFATVTKEGGFTKQVDAPVNAIPVYLRGGSIVPTQQEANTTAVARTTDYTLIVVLDNKGTASGDLYIDDGVSLVQKESYYIQFDVKNSMLQSQTKKQVLRPFLSIPPLTTIKVVGITNHPAKALCNSQPVGDFKFENGLLQLGSLKLSLVSDLKCEWM
jgi:alpha-glucosidase (family GH31 glycosyl hydrolase)